MEHVLKHLAIVLDGNGRWALAKGLDRTAGHAYGVEAVRRVIKAAKELKIRYLTLFGLSLENWQRPKSEVARLISLLDTYLETDTDELANEGIAVKFIGETSLLPVATRLKIANAQRITRYGRSMTLTVAFSYGSRDEIFGACQKIANRVEAGELRAAELTKSVFAETLQTHEVPDPDLLIRTGGEVRLSNFLLWQLAYTELYFTPVLWPDFDGYHLKRAVDHFYRRVRTFGQIPEKTTWQSLERIER